MSDNAKQRGRGEVQSSLGKSTATPLKWIQASLVVFGTAMALIILSGCASAGAPRGGSSESALEYNPETGYPLIGGRRWFF
jgi:hypothetical protein